MDTNEQLRELMKKYEQQIQEYRKMSKTEEQPALLTESTQTTPTEKPQFSELTSDDYQDAVQPQQQPQFQSQFQPQAQTQFEPQQPQPQQLQPQSQSQPQQTQQTQRTEQQTVQQPSTEIQPIQEQQVPPADTAAGRREVTPVEFAGEYNAPSVERSQIIIPPERTNYEGTGYLKIEVYTAKRAQPIVGATASISSEDTNGDKLMFTGVTDESGETRLFELPTVSRRESEVPGNNAPYAAYDIRVVKDGYFTIKNTNIPIFDEQTAFQPVEMIPIPENYTGDETTQIYQTGPVSL